MVSILFCRREKIRAGHCWAVRPVPAERDYITLPCLLNHTYDRVLHYYVAPKLGNGNTLACVEGAVHSCEKP
jgi:hypothetical protein